MYLNALEFLEEEREAWRPYEALDALDDAALDRRVEAAHGWSARDLMGHMTLWQEWALAIAKDLAVRETSPAIARLDAEWEAKGDAMNDEAVEAWRALPVAEVRERFRAAAGELRGYLTVVPEIRWLKDPAVVKTLFDETTAHYADHLDDLRAILAAG